MHPQPTLHRVVCQSAQDGQPARHMAYWQWGAADAPHVVLCVHGLTRQGRDFDVLAQALCQRLGHPVRVVCPDVAGRGQSDPLANPLNYHAFTYAQDMQALLAQLCAVAPVQRLDWVGTSMGGLIAMVLAGQPALQTATGSWTPIANLVLNDVGPLVAWSFMQRLRSYVGQPLHFSSPEQAADQLQQTYSGFGPHTPAQWTALSLPMIRPAPGGGWTQHYDLAIAAPLQGLTPEQSAQGAALMWQLYDAITARTLLLRGALSDLLSPDLVQDMQARGPRPRLVTFEGVGHAPTLVANDQTDAVASFLLASPT